MSLDDLSRAIRARFDQKNAARERALPASRRAIRCCANAIRALHRGEREEAVLIATLIVRADLALCLADLAADVGRGMMRAEPVVWMAAMPERPVWRH